ncbi:MAG: cytochrome C peroxidase [Bacteroidetes bacterium]|nr:cytochrome C peroxidase [Bacteroidota bacterium]
MLRSDDRPTAILALGFGANPGIIYVIIPTMKFKVAAFLCLVFLTITLFSFKEDEKSPYTALYEQKIAEFSGSLDHLLEAADRYSSGTEADKVAISAALNEARIKMKNIDLWLRYLAPIRYKQINSPLPVEWETEVFEKFEAPYRRDGAGLMLAEDHLAEGGDMEGFTAWIKPALKNLEVYSSDSILPVINNRHHFLLANRLFLLNLASIYTTGFECPNTDRVIPELREMMQSTKGIYIAYGQTWPDFSLSEEYLMRYVLAVNFVMQQPNDFSKFDHFSFIRDHVNPLFRLNQELILEYSVRSMSFNDYSLNNDARSIFSKELYEGQNAAGMFASVKDEEVLHDIKAVGRQLFFDPILSGNNKRSCASCHKPDQFLGDGLKYNLHLSGTDVLTRNTPTLVNVVYNHLLLLDGKQISAQSQAIGVMTNPDEMGSIKEEITEKVMSCKEYKKAFNSFLPYSRGSKSVSINHIVSAITLFYADFSLGLSPFDQAMNNHGEVNRDVVEGFNVFMSKAQCGTCHFTPQFNGVKPPYVGSEFEVIGVPVDTEFSALSPDSGRYHILPEPEMVNAFRTGSIRNADLTGPYMHNGVFETLEQVVDFYNDGGGTGRGLSVPNQTLSSEPLELTEIEKEQLIAFMLALTEDITMPTAPTSLPSSSNSSFNNRVVGGEY